AGLPDSAVSAPPTARAVLHATARPGTVGHVAPSVAPPTGMMRGTAAIALTLFAHDTPILLDAGISETSDVAKWLKFHTSAPVIADSSICSFALIGDARNLPALDRFSFGSSEYPDRSTTLILQVESLTQGAAYELRGPGIDGAAILQAKISPANLFERLAINAALFPRGIDVVLVHDDAIVAIPRTTRLTVHGG